jgi:hypothetical protein
MLGGFLYLKKEAQPDSETQHCIERQTIGKSQKRDHFHISEEINTKIQRNKFCPFLCINPLGLVRLTQTCLFTISVFPSILRITFSSVEWNPKHSPGV